LMGTGPTCTIMHWLTISGFWVTGTVRCCCDKLSSEINRLIPIYHFKYWTTLGTLYRRCNLWICTEYSSGVIIDRMFILMKIQWTDHDNMTKKKQTMGAKVIIILYCDSLYYELWNYVSFSRAELITILNYIGHIISQRIIFKCVHLFWTIKVRCKEGN